jgi:hypothetical protein
VQDVGIGASIGAAAGGQNPQRRLDVGALNAKACLDDDGAGVVAFESNPVFCAPIFMSATETQLQQPPRPSELFTRLVMMAMAMERPHRFGKRLEARINPPGRRNHERPLLLCFG